MKKTKLTRSLMAACSIVALSAVMYGCVHSGDDTAMDDPPPPPAAVNLMGSTDLMPGMTTIPAGGSVTVGYTTLSCDGDEACALTVERDEVTGQLTATSTGGTVTVAYSPPADPTVNMVDLMGSPDLMAGTTTIAAGGSVTVGNTVVSCPAGGEDCVLTVAEDMVTGMMTATSTGGAATVAYTPPPEPTVHALNLPDGHGLGVGTVTLQPGESHTSGRTVITCPDGGDPCVVELTENDVTGVVSATSTGALAMVSITPLPAGLAALQAFGAAMDAAAAGAGDALDEPTLRAAFSSTVGNNGITTLLRDAWQQPVACDGHADVVQHPGDEQLRGWGRGSRGAHGRRAGRDRRNHGCGHDCGPGFGAYDRSRHHRERGGRVGGHG